MAEQNTANSLNLEGKRWCYVIPINQDVEKYGGYVPSLVIEN
jgi:hypothetical protein